MTNSEQKNISLREAVIKTIIFFDLFNYPLTRWEIWQNLPLETDLATIEDIIASLVLQDIIWQKEGFYFLPGNQQLIDIRRERYNYANQKIKIARRASRWFRLMPSVKLVAVSNIIGHHNLRDESDIDIFIISSPRRIWLDRLFCTGLMKIANQRPSKGNKRNKMCLSFYATADSLNMERLRFKPEDPYFNHWFLGLYPVYDQDRYLSYLRFKNPWLKEAFPNSLLLKEKFPEDYWHRNLAEWIFFITGDLFNWLAKKIQMAIMPKRLRDMANKDAGVMISDSILRFYVNDRREEFHKKYRDKLAAFKIYE